jgi:hypothetical protein
VRIAYLDESGSPELTGGTSHFVLLAVAIDAQSWKDKDRDIGTIKRACGLEGVEIHAGWLARRYAEQKLIPGFEGLSPQQRVAEVKKVREQMLLKRAALRGISSLKELKKNFSKTENYVHLTYEERRDVLRAIARQVNGWKDCHLFAECTDKTAFGGTPPPTPPFEEAFAQVVTRFQFCLNEANDYGMLVQDRNDTVASRLTELMRRFHERGTRYTGSIPRLIETPLFVDSRLTSMVQVADVCAYATRRYFENGEEELFNLVYPKFRRRGGRCVGARHYRGQRACSCRMCADH